MIGLKMTGRIQKFAALVRAFARSRRGNVAMLFAISLVPLMLAAGVGLDYARAMLVRQQMSEALDAAALAIGSSTGLTQSTAQTLAQKFFDANYTVDKTAFGTPTVTIPTSGYNSTGSVVLTATNPMPTILVKLAGFNTLAVTATSTVVWGQSKLWVALALDNSGSMSQGDASGTKMDALQNASKQLLTTLQAASTTVGDVQVAIVPFANLVKPNLSGTTYIDYREFDAQPPLDTGYMSIAAIVNGLDFRAYGPGTPCPFDGGDGYVCAKTPTNDTTCRPDYLPYWWNTCTADVPSSGSYIGYICPSQNDASNDDGRNSRFYNGCYTSTQDGTNKVTISSGTFASCPASPNNFPTCSCSGTGSSKTCKVQRWIHAWVTNPHSSWGGCVMDRQRNGATTYGSTAATQDYDTSKTTPSSGDSLFPAVNYANCLTATVTPLPATWTAAQWTTLSTKIDAMAPGGSTNQAIGMEHAWQALTPGAPYAVPTVPANTSRFIILLSDGLNTQNRWYGNGTTEGTTTDGYIDTRTISACTKAKADGIIIYSILLDIGGNLDRDTLESCATDSTKFFDLTSTSGVVTTFNQIAQQITNVRVSR
jgi:Flp pilus assembly protein TadG